ncbi:MAG TPA: hypothetical protein VGB59_10370 [Allosphingosinicella sp.]
MIADEIRQESNGKRFIIGYYTDVRLEARPPEKSLFVHAAITELSEGEHEASVTLRNMTKKKTLKLEPDRFRSSGPDDIFLLITELQGFTFPSPGTYRVEINVDGVKRGQTYVSLRFPEEEVQEEEAGEATG